jgi:hypothetical protein
MRRWQAVAACLLVVVAIIALGARATDHDSGPAAGSPAAPVKSATNSAQSSVGAPPGSPFGAGSIWRTSVSGAPAAADSTTLVRNLVAQVAAHSKGVASFNAWQYNTSFYTATATTPIVDVAWDNCQHKPHAPAGLVGSGGQFSAVPIPADAVPAVGLDAELTVYSPSSDQLWELWKAAHDAHGWHACWGGRIDHVSTSPGYFLNGFGATATGLPVAGGMVSFADVRRGSIDHAVALTIVEPASWRVVSWPAQRSDGTPGSTAPIAEGTRFRLDPSINVDALNLTPIAKMIAKAAQRYGFIVIDRADVVSVLGQSGAGAQAATGVNPWTALLGKTPSYLMMRNFPWDKLEALPRNYGKP